MSFILDALGRVEALRGQKTAALSRVAVRPVAAAAGARDKVPPPPPLAEPGDTALAASTPAPHNPLDDVQPLSVLPLELQALVQRMKVRVHVYAPVPRQRFVMVDSRQLREG